MAPSRQRRCVHLAGLDSVARGRDGPLCALALLTALSGTAGRCQVSSSLIAPGRIRGGSPKGSPAWAAPSTCTGGSLSDPLGRIADGCRRLEHSTQGHRGSANSTSTRPLPRSVTRTTESPARAAARRTRRLTDDMGTFQGGTSPGRARDRLGPDRRTHPSRIGVFIGAPRKELRSLAVLPPVSTRCPATHHRSPGVSHRVEEPGRDERRACGRRWRRRLRSRHKST